MEEHGKRKPAESQGENENNAFSARPSKTRKVEDPQQQNNIGQLLNRDGPRGSTLTEKLVSMWLTGNKGRDSVLTQEVRESKALQESQEKYAEAQALLEKMQQKVQSAEVRISSLTKSLHTQKKDNTDLLEKLNLTHEMVTTITDHINCAIDTLERCGQYNDQLSRLYHDIILQQRTDIRNLQDHEKSLNRQLSELRAEVLSSSKTLNELQCGYEDKLKEKDTRLSNVTAECNALREELKKALVEKEEISRALSIKETDSLDFQKHISKYETQVKNLSTHVSELSAKLTVLNEENARLKCDSISKENERMKLVEDLDSIKLKCAEEIAVLKSLNLELEEKVDREFDQRETLRKMLNETTEIKDELVRRIEKLKEDAATEIEAMKKQLENANREKLQINEEGKKIIDEMEKRYQFQTEKCESLVAEIKALKENYQSELARASSSSSVTITNVNAENCRLTTELDSLKREKEEQEVQLRRVEDLLIKHTESEIQLKRKVEQYEDEAAALTAAAAAAAEYKKNQEAENRENITKISNLEKELLKLQFDRASSIIPMQPKGTADVENRGKSPSTRKISAPTTYQKSILKGTAKPRKARSSPPSPSFPANKKITFLDLDSASDTSPMKLADTPNQFPNTGDVYDTFSGFGKSPSQQLRSSQARSQSLSQPQHAGRKFFKSRNK